MKNNKNNFILQGSILAMAGILTRMIGIVYRIPLNNILGNSGSAAYSIAFDIYSLFLLISSLSMPVAVSKIVSTRMAKGEFKNAKKGFVGALIIATIIGIVVSTFLFMFSDKFAKIWGFESAAMAIKVLAPTLFVMCILGVLRGFFQGMGTMIPTAVSQIFEQIVNAVVSIVAAIVLLGIGEKVGKGISYSAAGGTLGTATGAFTALVFLAFIYKIYSGRFNKKVKRDLYSKEESFSELNRALMYTIFPVLLSTTIYNLGSILDSAMFGNIMARVFKIAESDYSGYWGIYANRYRLLTTAPIAIASALSAAIIPSLVRSCVHGNKKEVRSKINNVIKVTMLVAIPCGAGLSFLGGPVIDLLFPGQDLHNESIYLMRFSLVTVVAYSFSTITNSILQGIDKMKIPVFNSGVALIMHIFILPILLIGFKLNIFGIVIADFIFAFTVCIFNIYQIKKYTRYRQELLKTFIIPVFASLLMGLICYYSQKLMRIVIPGKISTFFAIILGVIIYFILLLFFKVIGENELKMIPKGHKIISVLKKYNLL